MREALRGNGDLAELSTLLQLVEMEVLTGRVRYDRGGEIGVYGGSIVRAGLGRLSGVGALLEMFLVTSGPFGVDVGAEPKAPPLGSTAALVLDGCRLLDDWRRIESLFLSAGRAGPLPPPLQALQFDGRLPTGSVLAAAGAARHPLVDPILQAIESGVLVEVARAAPAVPAANAATYEACMEEGRRCVRGGRLAEARARFSEAITLRPDDRVAIQNLRRVAAMEAR